MPEKALITGGSGLIGKRLTDLLLAKGWDVVHLGRHPAHKGVKTFRWEPSTNSIDAHAFDGVTKIIHLAGASIAGRRWTKAYKREILDSRIQSTRLLYDHLSKGLGRVDKLVSASAIGIYGAGVTTEVFSENDRSGSDFLADVVAKWEREVNRIGSLGIPVAIVRTGIVLSKEGGALAQMAMPVRFGLGAPLGSGEQSISWIHVDDLCGIYMYLLESDLDGTYNATAPQPVSNAMLTKAIAHQLNKPLWLPNVPAFVLRLLLGELAEAVLTGSNVSSQKISSAGYAFKFSNVAEALKDLYQKK